MHAVTLNIEFRAGVRQWGAVGSHGRRPGVVTKMSARGSPVVRKGKREGQRSNCRSAASMLLASTSDKLMS